MIPLLLACARPPAPAAGPASLLPLPTPPLAETSALVEDGDALLLTWQVSGEAGSSLHLSRFDAAGWSPPVQVASGANLLVNWADYPSAVRGGDGALYTHWLRREDGGGFAYDVEVLRSDDGAAWTSLGTLNSDEEIAEHGFVSWVPTPTGARAVWLDGRGMAAGQPMSLRAAEVDKTVHDEVVVDPRVCDCCRTDAAGELVVYRDRGDTELRDIRVARLSDDLWLDAPLSSDAWQIAGCPVNGPDIECAESGAVTAWFTAPDAPRVRVAFGDGASFGPSIQVAPGPGEPVPLGRVLVAPVGDEALVFWLAAVDEAVAAVTVRRVAPDGRVGPAAELGRTVNSRGAGFPTLARHGEELLVAWTVPSVGIEAVRLSPQDVPAVDALLEAQDDDGPTAPQGRPELDLTALDGSPLALPDGPVLVALWATWCGPCRDELPALQVLHDAGVPVIGASVDEAANAERVQDFVAELELSFPIAHDASLAAAFGTSAVPATYLFDANGDLIWHRVGAFDPADSELIQALSSLEPPPEIP